MNHDRLLSATRESSNPLAHVLLATAILLLVALALRFTTSIADLGPVWDEVFMQPIVEAMVHDGWTAEHLIDYEDTKGPVFFWAYAAAAEIVGSDVDRLRLVSFALFVLTGIPLGLIAARVGLGLKETAGVAALFAILPYQAVLAQLFMSEASFTLGIVLTAFAFLWGFGRDAATERRVAGPIIFFVLVALLLHHRPHVAALAGACVLVATERDGKRSWPWWLACAAAAIVRLPLYFHWGGIVSESYQERMGLGLRLESLTYVAIALLPCTFVLLWTALMGPHASRSRRIWVIAGAAVGLGLGALFVPDLSMTVDGGRARFMGLTATTLRAIESDGLLRVVLAFLGALGGAALAATFATGLAGTLEKPLDVVRRLAAWSILIGWALHGLTRGAVFDRYVLPFVAVLPFLYVRRVPRWLLAAQTIVLLFMVVKLSRNWLI